VAWHENYNSFHFGNSLNSGKLWLENSMKNKNYIIIPPALHKISLHSRILSLLSKTPQPERPPRKLNKLFHLH
jgi:hypothetical protein